jgi:ABC-type nitrate/sulfonate/bicarbonate transport system ATPase subunit
MYQKNETLLKAEGIGLTFKDQEDPKKKKVILKDVNFEIKNIVRPNMNQGQVVSLIGRSGSGKTQLLKMIAGLNKPTEGTLLIDQDQRPCAAGDTGLVPQDYYMFPWRRIHKILDLAARKNPKLQDEKIRAEAIEHYIDAFELRDHTNKFPAQLSGGQKQRVSIAQQLLRGSNFLLMDEPYSGLDSLMIDKTTSLLTRVAQSDELKTIIIVSHDLTNSVAISDTVFLLSKQGRAEDEGATIVKEICLIDMGLAWRPDIKELPAFHDVLKEIKSLL